MAGVTWEQCRSDFAWDGSWRDLYVRGASVKKWSSFLGALPSWPYRTEYRIGGEKAPLPPDAGQVFRAKEKAASDLSIAVDAVVLNCHFFVEDELEFDLDPRQVDGAATFEALLGFMRRLGVLLEASVVLTPENLATRPIVEFDPRTSEFRYFDP
jgi:hypothetical protein